VNERKDEQKNKRENREREREREEDRKYRGRNRGSTGKKIIETNGRKRAQQGRAEGKNISRRKHRGTNQHALAIAFIPSFPSPVFFSSSGATFSFIGISRGSSSQENREGARKHRGKNIHFASTSHLHHRLRRLQRKRRQEEIDRDQHQLPAVVIVFRISDDRLCARNCSIIFARQLSGKRPALLSLLQI
jgi:hypothetical protein